MRKPLKFSVENQHFWMLPVEGGSFAMGDEAGDLWEVCRPVHRVQLKRFYLAQFPLTQAIWQAVTGDSPAFFTGSRRPVETVSHDRIVQGEDDLPAFLAALNGHPDIQKDLPAGAVFRLPTEAEWEYAARGGIYNQSLKFAGSNRLKEVGWYEANSHGETKPAGRKCPNELGLYDMSGNVWEWCADWYGRYEETPQTDPAGPDSGINRVYRGGGWLAAPRHCRVAYRSRWRPGSRDHGLGFRLALSLQGEA